MITFKRFLIEGGAATSKFETWRATPADIGPSVKAKDVMTAEQVIQHIKKMPNAAQVLVAAKNELARLKLPIPSELSHETTSAN